ncbi:unnamed protein product [Clonostachys chloroleuca]|uniref:GFO/IDH/MocA-like oxidoreductase domain-containing protein n=1 Tax=Clonostachys chloroleuca TaxID=1926264 RepID=A0AA35MAA5_9HYPO|nr:unnamed protein product [Clonostachys chloroleuca]
MWLRHRPIVTKLRDILFEQNAIGRVSWLSSQYNLPVDIVSLPPTSRYRDPKLGAGSLLDVGIYPLTWALVSLERPEVDQLERPRILAAQTHSMGIEVTTNAVLQYSSTGQNALISSSFTAGRAVDPICRILGSSGYIDVIGEDASHPESLVVHRELSYGGFDLQQHDFTQAGQGFMFEQDNTALDVLSHRTESAIMPWAETIRVMEIMGEMRRQGGTVYPQDAEV